MNEHRHGCLALMLKNDEYLVCELAEPTTIESIRCSTQAKETTAVAEPDCSRITVQVVESHRNRTRIFGAGCRSCVRIIRGTLES